MHTAVSAGEEDFKLGKKLGLPMILVIADNADYLDTMGFLSGKNAKSIRTNFGLFEIWSTGHCVLSSISTAIRVLALRGRTGLESGR